MSRWPGKEVSLSHAEFRVAAEPTSRCLTLRSASPIGVSGDVGDDVVGGWLVVLTRQTTAWLMEWTCVEQTRKEKKKKKSCRKIKKKRNREKKGSQKKSRTPSCAASTEPQLNPRLQLSAGRMTGETRCRVRARGERGEGRGAPHAHPQRSDAQPNPGKSEAALYLCQPSQRTGHTAEHLLSTFCTPHTTHHTPLASCLPLAILKPRHDHDTSPHSHNVIALVSQSSVSRHASKRRPMT